MRGIYDPEILIVGWEAPPEGSGQRWLRLPVWGPPVRNRAGFVVRFVPNLYRLWAISREKTAINAHYPGLELLPLVLLRRLGLAPKLILSVHGSDLIEPLAARGIRRALYAWMFRSADVVIACSGELADRVRRVCPAARVRVVWNAVDRPPAGEPPHPWPGHRYLVCVAGFVKVKGHDVLLRAFERIAAERPELDLVLIGAEGPELAGVRERIEAAGLSGRVRILVNVPHEEVWGWVGHAECLVLASRQEAFGIVLLEAAMVGRPVVATALGGIREFVNDREHALLCEPGSAEGLAGAVLETLADPEATRQRVERFRRHAEGFRWEETLRRYRAAAGLP